MSRSTTVRSVRLGVAVALVGGASLLTAAPPEDQLKFGVEMAQRGLWKEALFRFEQAERQSGADPEILNNMAVAQEALGRFEEALETYRRALKSSPTNRQLRQNYSRFLEFYQSFRPQEDEAEGAEATAAGGAGEEVPAPDTTSGGASGGAVGSEGAR